MLFGGPCTKPFPPHSLYHLQLVGLTSWGASLLRALLLLLSLGGRLVLSPPPFLLGRDISFLGGTSTAPLMNGKAWATWTTWLPASPLPCGLPWPDTPFVAIALLRSRCWT